MKREGGLVGCGVGRYLVGRGRRIGRVGRAIGCFNAFRREQLRERRAYERRKIQQIPPRDELARRVRGQPFAPFRQEFIDFIAADPVMFVAVEYRNQDVNVAQHLPQAQAVVPQREVVVPARAPRRLRRIERTGFDFDFIPERPEQPFGEVRTIGIELDPHEERGDPRRF